jgi:hypothetical protein
LIQGCAAVSAAIPKVRGRFDRVLKGVAIPRPAQLAQARPWFGKQGRAGSGISWILSLALVVFDTWLALVLVDPRFTIYSL